MAIVDADLHPAATGAAADIVKQHESVEADHILYSGWFCASSGFLQNRWSADRLVAICPTFLDRPRGEEDSLQIPGDKSIQQGKTRSLVAAAVLLLVRSRCWVVLRSP